MSRATRWIRRTMMTALLMGMAVHAFAQVEPFKKMPADVNFVARVDYSALTAMPSAKGSLEELAASFPDWRAFVFHMAKDPSVTSMAAGFPGEIVVFEWGLGWDLTVTEGEAESSYALLMGRLDGAGIIVKMQQSGWTPAGDHQGLSLFASKEGDLFATMPNEWTFAMSGSSAGLRRVIDVSRGAGPSVATAGSATTRMALSVAGSPITIAMDLPPQVRDGMTARASQPEMAMIAGMPDFLRELRNATGAAAFLSTNEQGAAINLGATFTDEAAAARAVTALNRVIPFVTEIAKNASINEGDHYAARKMQEWSSLRVGHSGSRIYLTVPYTHEDIAKIVEAGRESAGFRSSQPARPAPSGGR